jgi:hypothetical protein
MFPSSAISITLTDLLEQPELFKSILEYLVKICEKEIDEKEPPKQRKPRLRKKKVELEDIKEE